MHPIIESGPHLHRQPTLWREAGCTLLKPARGIKRLRVGIRVGQIKNDQVPRCRACSKKRLPVHRVYIDARVAPGEYALMHRGHESHACRQHLGVDLHQIGLAECRIAAQFAHAAPIAAVDHQRSAWVWVQASRGVRHVRAHSLRPGHLQQGRPQFNLTRAVYTKQKPACRPNPCPGPLKEIV